MRREITERTILDTFAQDFVDVVEKHANYIIVSGFVAIAHGRSRGTEDVGLIEKIRKLRERNYSLSSGGSIFGMPSSMG